MTTPRVAQLVPDNTVLLVLSDPTEPRVADLIQNFFGTVVVSPAPLPNLHNKTLYLSGNISKADSDLLAAPSRVLVISEFSYGYNQGTFSLVSLGRVPISVHGVGVLYRRFFEKPDYFDNICTDHDFQQLTESTKPGIAHRTGIYLTPVQRIGEDLHFSLLRCSSNFSGPTANFSALDHEIADALNEEASRIFENNAPLNHVLAQVYHNTPATADHKQSKASIKAHSDKTKDMPPDAIMAFCTFYDDVSSFEPLEHNPFDLGCKGKSSSVLSSAMTTLYFRLKSQLSHLPECPLVRQFSVTLSPNSVFFMPLTTNRWYTHEIRPSSLDASVLPTRMGYVVRCSSTKVVFKNGQTHLEYNGELFTLEKSTPEGMAALREKYAQENLGIEPVTYGFFPFSMNKGDYMQPILSTAFRCFPVPTVENIFDELCLATTFEQGKAIGRQGTILVKLDPIRGTPIVRSTDKFEFPAQSFHAVHEELARAIEEAARLPEGCLNNALIEKYTNEYYKMGFHSDMAIDLQEGTNIALFSCYKFPDRADPPRKLVVQPKAGGETFEIPLLHQTVVVFSLDTNRRHLHKIVLSAAAPENEWVGVTFRTSKTFVQLRDKRAHLQDGSQLTLATEVQCKEFYKLRSCENKQVDFIYPPLPFTLSEQDLLEPR
eukprot:c15937_g1_i2.p1 GENE.c15937_g1_i2~~c15937_g1_i2.p1  ORF type:complete len:669 (+),score=130.06 c15937_g1_i2:34-2007(+)